MSEQMAKQTGGKAASLNVASAEPDWSDVPGEAAAAAAPVKPHEPARADITAATLKNVSERAARARRADAARLESVKPESVRAETAKPDSPKPESVRAESAKPDSPKPDSLRGESAKPESAKPESAKPESAKPDSAKPNSAKPDAPPVPGKVLIMSPGDRAREDGGAKPLQDAAPMFGKRRYSALAAVVALAALAGALGGALATVGMRHFSGDVVANAGNSTGNDALEAAVARIDADILSLKASVEQTSSLGVNQFNKTSDRLDRLEKAQAEPAAKLARLSEGLDRLRAAAPLASAPVAAAPAAAAKETTGSITPPTAAAPAAAPRVEVARLPTVQGWVLRRVSNSGAYIEGPQGVYEVFAGDPVPGLGRVEAIRRQDGRWVVVTSKGLVVAR